MKILTTSLFLFLITICGYAQCADLNISVSASSETTVQLYTAAFFLIPSGQDNVIDWLVTNDLGNIIHEETTSGSFNDQSTINFTHSVPTTDAMNVSVTITNTTSNIVCTIADVLVWQGNIINWAFTNGSTGILPVELVDFKGDLSDQQVNLTWKTTIEENNLGFEIEKSSDNIRWETIDFVKGQANSAQLNQYQSYDNSPYNGINYYRLKQIDFDGHFEYSNILAIEYRKTNSELIVFPNPSTGSVNISISNAEYHDAYIRITDTHGRLVWQTNPNPREQTWNENIQIQSNGVYFISLITGDEIRQEKLVVKR